MEFDKKRMINTGEVIRYLGYEGNTPDEEMLELIKECEEEIVNAAVPLFKYKKGDIKVQDDGLSVCDGRLFLFGNSIKEHLKDCEYTVLCCETLSKKVDDIIDTAQKEDMLKALILDACANAAVEELRLYAEELITEEYPDYEVIWQFGIGYGDLPLSLQHDFLNELGASDIGVSANKSCILTPLKSVSGFLGLKKKINTTSDSEPAMKCRQRGCAVCSNREKCIYKKLPD